MNAPKKENFLKKLLHLILPAANPDLIKKKKLKEIAKNLSKTKYGRWYKASSKEILPPFGQFIHDIYKVVGPSRGLLLNVTSSKVLKNLTVEFFLSAKQKKMLDRFSENSLQEFASTQPPKELVAQIKKELDVFVKEITTEQIEQIDEIYAQLDAFIHFVIFDYYFMLKKFDTNIKENDFNYIPQFKSVRGEYSIDDLKDFSSVLYALPQQGNWEDIFNIIKAYKNIMPVIPAQWKKLVNTVNDLKRSNAMEYLIQHISEDIFYKIEIEASSEKIADNYIKNVRQNCETALNKMLEDQRSGKVAVLVKKIFGDNVMSGTKNYTVAANAPFIKRGLHGFIYAEGLNYLKSFLIEYVKTDIRGLSELFLVRGNWGPQSLTTEYSNSYHSLLQLSSTIIEFDDKVSEVSELGVKFRTLLSRMEREKAAKQQVEKLLADVNGSALKILTAATKHIIVIGNNFKNIIADYDKPRRELIQNWKEIEQHSDKPIREWLEGSYKTIYNFVMLMQIFLKQ